MSFKEAKETFGQMLRWTEQPKDQAQGEKTIFIGAVVTGFYAGKKEGVGKNSSTVYELKLENGQLVSFWGSDLLDGKFAEIPQGCQVRVTYLGTAQPKTPAGRAYQNFRVEYDETSRMPMKAAGEVAAPGGAAAAPVDTRSQADIDFDNIGSKNNTPPAAGEGY